MHPDAWHLSRFGEEAPFPSAFGHTLPLITHDDAGRWSLVGTAFYVSDSGMFVTARHNFDDVFHGERQVAPLVLVEFQSDGSFLPESHQLRPIMQVWLSDRADVAVGLAAQASHKQTGAMHSNFALTLGWERPPVGAPVVTYAFPAHIVSDDGRRISFAPNAYGGHVRAVGDFRDRLLIPYPYVEVDCRIHGAASGGPILAAGVAAAINTREMTGEPAGPAYGALSQCVGRAFFDAVYLPGEQQPRHVSFDELVRANTVNVEGYCSIAGDDGRLVFFEKAYTAPRPVIEFSAAI